MDKERQIYKYMNGELWCTIHGYKGYYANQKGDILGKRGKKLTKRVNKYGYETVSVIKTDAKKNVIAEGIKNGYTYKDITKGLRRGIKYKNKRVTKEQVVYIYTCSKTVKQLKEELNIKETTIHAIRNQQNHYKTTKNLVKGDW